MVSLSLCHEVYGKANNQAPSLKCHLAEAKKIIADQMPGQELLAEKMLINCIRIHPKYLEPIIELAKFIEQEVNAGERPMFEVQKSLALVSQAYDIAPNNPRVRYVMAHLYATLGQYEESQSLYEKTIKEFPRNRDTFIEKARLLLDMDPGESLNLIEQSVNMGTNVDEIVDLILSCVRYKSTATTYSALLAEQADKYQNRWLSHKLGLVYLDEKKYKLAAQSFLKAIDLGNKIESKLQLGVVQYLYLNDFSGAVSNFESLLDEIKKGEFTPGASESLVYSHYALALLLNKNRQKSADAAIEVALKSNGNRDYLKSLVYEFKSRHELSLLQPALEAVVKIDPSFDMAYAYLGEIYEQKKQYPEAIDALEKAIILNPQNDSYFAMKGSIYYKMKNFESSLKNYESALDLNHGAPIYRYNIACIFALTGKIKEAINMLKLVLSADLNFLERAKNDPDFNLIKSDFYYAKEFASLFFQNYDGQWASTDSNLKSRP